MEIKDIVSINEEFMDKYFRVQLLENDEIITMKVDDHCLILALIRDNQRLEQMILELQGKYN